VLGFVVLGNLAGAIGRARYTGKKQAGCKKGLAPPIDKEPNKGLPQNPNS